MVGARPGRALRECRGPVPRNPGSDAAGGPRGRRAEEPRAARLDHPPGRIEPALSVGYPLVRTSRPFRLAAPGGPSASRPLTADLIEQAVAPVGGIERAKRLLEQYELGRIETGEAGRLFAGLEPIDADAKLGRELAESRDARVPLAAFDSADVRVRDAFAGDLALGESELEPTLAYALSDPHPQSNLLRHSINPH